MTTAEADRNLLFGVLALQGDLIDNNQFVEACSAWAATKERPLSEVLLTRGWINEEDRGLINGLLERKLARHAGDAHKSLIAATDGGAERIKETVGALKASITDPDIAHSLAGLPSMKGFHLISTIGHPHETRDRYTLTTLHAKGGIGQVWVAHDQSLGREVVLKELRPERMDNAALVARFVREATITGRLDHPGIVPVYELIRGDKTGDLDRPYYTMRFIRGRTLSQAVAEYHQKREHKLARPTDLLALVQAFVGVCNTVAFAHSRGVIHRDLKGNNIVLGEFGEVVLLDWGLAKVLEGSTGAVDELNEDPDATINWTASNPEDPALTSVGEVLGTPAYMAPEQAEGKLSALGKRTDVYGLGAILYEILAGRPPFDGTSTRDVLRKVVEDAPVPPQQFNPGAPRALQAICLKAMAKDPVARFASATELASDIQHWMADEPVSVYREPWTTTLLRWGRRNRQAAATVLGGLVVAAVALGIISANQTRSNQSLRAALDRADHATAIASDEAIHAERAISALYEGITEDVMLRRPELTELRERLLGAALNFYDQRNQFLSDNWTNQYQDFNRSNSTAVGLERIATLQALLGRRDAAIEARRKQIEILGKLKGNNPTMLPEAMATLGNLQRSAGKPTDAVRSLREALRQFEQLNQPQKAALYRADLGRLLFDMGESDEGKRLLESAREAQEEFATPGVREKTNLRGQLASTYTTLGNIAEAEDRPKDAIDFYEKSLAIFKELLALLPADTFYQVELARSYNNLGLAKAALGRIDDGRADIEKGLKLREALLADKPLNIEYRADLARSYYHKARVDLLDQKPDAALHNIQEALRLYADIPPKAPEDLYFQACMKSIHGDLASGDESRRFQDEAMVLLKKAAEQGYKNPNRLKNDQALKSIRLRSDFP